MCESRVVLIEGGSEKVVMEEVILIDTDGEDLNLVGVLGQRKTVEGARIVKMDMDRHTIYLEKR